MQCKWDDFTGVECKKEATAIVVDKRRMRDVPLCTEHYKEYLSDHGLK